LYFKKIQIFSKNRRKKTMKTGLDSSSCQHCKGSRFRVLGLLFSCFLCIVIDCFQH
jgi:hypothetical protein